MRGRIGRALRKYTFAFLKKNSVTVLLPWAAAWFRGKGAVFFFFYGRGRRMVDGEWDPEGF